MLPHVYDNQLLFLPSFILSCATGLVPQVIYVIRVRTTDPLNRTCTKKRIDVSSRSPFGHRLDRIHSDSGVARRSSNTVAGATVLVTRDDSNVPSRAVKYVEAKETKT